MSARILVIGATGMLGQPVVNCLADKGHKVRILTRNIKRTQNMFGDTVESIEGTATSREDVRSALVGIDAVHINLSPATEYTAMQNVVDLAQNQLERISYVSATTLSEENRWFDRVDLKLRTEALLKNSGIQHAIFRPTWVMETLQNFINGSWAIVVHGKNPPALHFFAAADFGRIVADSYDDDRVLGEILYVYGPEAITLSDAMERFVAACYPEARVMRLNLWQAGLIAKLIRNQSLAEVTELLAYLDVAGEHGDPSKTEALFGAPAITLDRWFELPKESHSEWPH